MTLKTSQIATMLCLLCTTTAYPASGGTIPTRPVPGTHTCPNYYPREAIRHDISGDVLVHFDVESNGSLSHVFVLKSSGAPALDLAAVTCVSKRWRNIPARNDGIAIASPNHKATIHFALTGSRIPEYVVSRAVRIYVLLAAIVVFACFAFALWKDRHRGTPR